MTTLLPTDKTGWKVTYDTMEVHEEGLTKIQQINVRVPELIKKAFARQALGKRMTIKDQASEAIHCYLGFTPWPILDEPIDFSDQEKEFISYYPIGNRTIPKYFQDFTTFPQGQLGQFNIRINAQTGQVLKIVAQIQKKYLETVVTEAFLEYLNVLPRQARNYSHLTNLVH